MFADAKFGLFDVLLVLDQSRYARNWRRPAVSRTNRMVLALSSPTSPTTSSVRLATGFGGGVLQIGWRRLVGRLLSSHGWRVIVTPDATRALVESGGLRIDLLVTDYEMPGTSGIELAAQLRERNPSIRVLVVSGRPDLGELVEDPTIRIVTKPFDINALLESVTVLVNLRSAATGERGTLA